MSVTDNYNAASARWILIAFFACMAFAAIPTSSAYLVAGSTGAALWFRYFWYISTYYLIWVMLLPLIYRLAVGVLHPRLGWARTIAGHLGIYTVLSVCSAVIVHQSEWRLWLLGNNANGYFTMSGFSYIMVLLGIYFYYLQQKIRDQEAVIAEGRQKQLQLESTLARAQIDSLKGQMNPHFLFNALNCIGALIETGKNDLAYLALEDLGEMLHISLEQRSSETIALKDELAFTERYVAMEKMRFADRLELQVDMDPVCAYLNVPPLTLQPLVENSVKHAVSPGTEPVLVTISARLEGDTLTLCVKDNGQMQQANSKGTGLGLANLRQRLALYYGEQSALEFSMDPTGATAVVLIPLNHPAVEKQNPATRKSEDELGEMSLQH